MSDFFKKWMKEHQEMEKGEFDTVYLPFKEELPRELHSSKQQLDNPYFVHRLHANSYEELGEYHCTNLNCKRALFYGDVKDQLCPKCKTEISDHIYSQFQRDIQEYGNLENNTQNAIDTAVQACLRNVLPSSIVSEIEGYVQMRYVQYHSMEKELEELYDRKQYTSDKNAIDILLNRHQDIYAIGDVVHISPYGHHFIGFDDQNQRLKIIVNPAYEGYDRRNSIDMLCVPREISNDMPDVLRFYRMNAQNMNLFAAGDCAKIRNFPVSIVAMSAKHDYIKKSFRTQSGVEFDEAAFSFYVESTDFRQSDALHVCVSSVERDELKSFPLKIFQDETLTRTLREQLMVLHQKMKEQQFFMLCSDCKLDSQESLQQLCDSINLKWKVIGRPHAYDGCMEVWKILVDGRKSRDDVYSDIDELSHYSSIVLEPATYIMLFYAKQLRRHTDFAKWLTDIEKDADIHLLQNQENELRRIQLFWYPTSKFGQYPVSDAAVKIFEEKYDEDLVIRCVPCFMPEQHWINVLLTC